MEKSLQALLDGLIDYAGLFPPASLDMRTAVANYAAYRKSAEARWLGRFVLPVARLEEFAEAAATADAAERSSGGGSPAAGGSRKDSPWRLSVLVGASLPADLARIDAFNRAAAAQAPRDALAAGIDALEMKVSAPGEIAAALPLIPAHLTPYFEIPLKEGPVPFLDVLMAAGGRAKIRTGGVTPDLIPDPAEVASFLAACARAKVPFKATAGLHHPFRSRRRLTYAPDGPVAVMHGFLNVFLAAALAAEGAPEAEVAGLLGEEDPAAFEFRGDGAAWRGRNIPRERIAAARREFALGFGSCSFEEPREDLAEAKLL